VSRLPRLDAGARTPASVTRALEPVLCDDLTGIIGRLQRQDAPTGDPGDVAGVVGFGAFCAGRGQQALGNVGSYGFDAEIARVRAIGEGVDRYAWSRAVDHVTVRQVPFTQLPGPAVDPDALVRPNAEERARWGFVDYAPTLPQDWISGVRVARRATSLELEPAFVPAQLVAGPADPRTRYTARFPTQIGAGNTFVEAAVGVLCEAIERDALARAWLYRTRCTHVALGSCTDPDVRRWIEHHEQRGRTPLVLVLPDVGEGIGVTTIAVALIDPAGPFYFHWAFATAINGVAAIRKAVEELEGNRYAVTPGFTIPVRLEDIRVHQDTFHYYQHPDRLAQLGFLREPAGVVAVTELQRETPATPLATFTELVSVIERAGFTVYLADLTPADLAPYPLHAVTAVVPGLCSVANANRPWQLGSKRLSPPPPNLGLAPIW
jgi:thiazole/oxazole-forming peptide maturase SagD family component